MEKFLTTSELAKRWKLSRRIALKNAQEAGIKKVRINQRCHRYDIKDIERFEQENKR